jgi:hypothetical protein
MQLHCWNKLWRLGLSIFAWNCYFLWNYICGLMTTKRLCKDPFMCLVLLKAKGLSSSSFSSTSIVVRCYPPCWHFSNNRFGFGELLDDLKRHMFFCKLSFNPIASSLDVEGYCGWASIDMINTYKFFSRKKCYINTSMINVEW